MTAANPVGNLTLAPDDTLGSASGVSWRVNFDASSTGTLVLGQSTLTLQAPTGTFFPAGPATAATATCSRT